MALSPDDAQEWRLRRIVARTKLALMSAVRYFQRMDIKFYDIAPSPVSPASGEPFYRAGVVAECGYLRQAVVWKTDSPDNGIDPQERENAKAWLTDWFKKNYP